MKKRLAFCSVVVGAAMMTALFAAYSPDQPVQAASSKEVTSRSPKVGVLLVSHGSRSRRWRESLLDLEKSVRDDVMALKGVERATSAFMEYTEPSIATRLEEFDNDGFTDVIIVPLLLTVSSHSFDDIPTICGQQENVVALERLRAEGIRVYKPRAKLHMTPLLDFADILGHNVLRRVTSLSEDARDEGVLLVGYGSADYEEEWAELLDRRLGTLLKEELGVPECRHSWCGHLVNYSPAVTQRAIADLLARRQRVLVVPVLVATDEMFQDGIIQNAVNGVAEKARVRYVPDAILPDAGVRRWVVAATRRAHRDILTRVES